MFEVSSRQAYKQELRVVTAHYANRNLRSR